MYCDLTRRVCMFFVCEGYGDHREQHVLTHSFPTRRSSDLTRPLPSSASDRAVPTAIGIEPPTMGTLAISPAAWRSEEHTSALQSLMRTSYAVFRLKKKTRSKYRHHTHQHTRH